MFGLFRTSATANFASQRRAVRDVDGSLLQVSVEAKGATWNSRAPIKLFERRYFVGANSGRSYDVSLDGQRFLMIKGPGTDASASPSLILVQHWDAELKRFAPTK